MVFNQRFLIILCFCLGIVALALTYELSNAERQDRILRVSGTEEQEIVLEPSSSFYTEDENGSSKTDKPTPTTSISPISAKAYVVGNVLTGEIYLMRKPNLVLPVASMSKLITAIESIDQFTLEKVVTINEDTQNVPDGIKLRIGDKFTVSELLYPLLLNSSNSVAEALASSSNRIAFMDLMSSYAWEIGMPSTFFADPSGLNPQNTSSANDFFALAKYLYKLRPDILAITRNATASLGTTTEHGSYEFTSTHPFAKDPDFIGGKTGRTPSARDTMLTIIKINNLPIAIVVLASEDRRRDTLFLRDMTRELLWQNTTPNF
jgi:D-alanyl-D-alanine endopeptidase (penicillin-binding protein 7)